MYLTVANLPYYLLSRGLVTTDAVISDDFAVMEAGRRNRNFKVFCKGRGGLFVKQISSSTADAIVTLQREASFYMRVRQQPSSLNLAQLIPTFVDYNQTTATLAVELLDNSENLTEYHARVHVFPEYVGINLGETLAQCHTEGASLPSGIFDRSMLPCKLPWILNLDWTTLAPLSQLGSVGTQLAAMIRQRPAIHRGLSAIQWEWRFDSLIHGDIKWDNCLIFQGKNRKPSLCIVDWELVDFGDGCWDVASIFASYFMYWIMTLGFQSSSTSLPNGKQLDTLPAMRPALQAFLRAYCEQRGLHFAQSHVYRDKCMRYCAARMILSVFEYSQGSSQLSPGALFALDVIERIFVAPRQSAWDLAGL